MNKTINNSLLTGDKPMSDFHLKQPGFTFSAARPFNKHRERIRKFRGTSNLKYLCVSYLYTSNIYLHSCDYLKEMSIKINVASDEGSSRNET